MQSQSVKFVLVSCWWFGFLVGFFFGGVAVRVLVAGFIFSHGKNLQQKAVIVF